MEFLRKEAHLSLTQVSVGRPRASSLEYGGNEGSEWKHPLINTHASIYM